MLRVKEDQVGDNYPGLLLQELFRQLCRLHEGSDKLFEPDFRQGDQDRVMRDQLQVFRILYQEVLPVSRVDLHRFPIDLHHFCQHHHSSQAEDPPQTSFANICFC